MQTASRLILLLASLILGAQHTAAQIYKVDGEDGVVFTDSPSSLGNTEKQKVEEVELSETNTAAPVQPRPRPSSAGTQAKEDTPAELTVAITSPADEATIAMGPGNFTVSAKADPPLQRGELLVLTMDGQAVGSAQRSASWFIEGALRGPHDLVVLRTTSRGETLASSEPIRVYVLRPSVIRR